MGLVNLRNAKLLVLSVTPAHLNELKQVSTKAGFKAVQTVDSIPAAIAALKSAKLDVLVVDSDLGGTAVSDFLKAIEVAFPKLKTLAVAPPGSAEPQSQSSVRFPLEEKAFGKAVDQLVMEKMGIAKAEVAFSEDL